MSHQVKSFTHTRFINAHRIEVKYKFQEKCVCVENSEKFVIDLDVIYLDGIWLNDTTMKTMHYGRIAIYQPKLVNECFFISSSLNFE